MLTMIKIGGSLITDKRIENHYRAEVAARVAAEIASSLDADPALRVLIGHGSGSFGHVAAKQYGTINGVTTPDQWRGFARVATVAGELSARVAWTLSEAGVPVWRLQPSASARAHDGRLVDMAIDPIRTALDRGLVPMIYGDVGLDEVRGGTILSTETIFIYLALRLPVQRILLLGEVEGVLDSDGRVISRITPASLREVERAIGASGGTDVTGGMETKVRDMLALAEALPQAEICIMSGLVPNLLESVLRRQANAGTVIAAG